MYVMLPVNFELSVPPKVNSPFVSDSAVVGSNETATKLLEIFPWLKRLPVTVGTVLWPFTVSSVKSTGPMLLAMMGNFHLISQKRGHTQEYHQRHQNHLLKMHHQCLDLWWQDFRWWLYRCTLYQRKIRNHTIQTRQIWEVDRLAIKYGNVPHDRLSICWYLS